MKQKDTDLIFQLFHEIRLQATLKQNKFKIARGLN